MLVAIVVLFVVCWAPLLLSNIFAAYDVISYFNMDPDIKYMRQAFYIMAYGNSCINPIVYGFMSRNFRDIFRRAVCGCLRGKQYVRRMTFKSQRSPSRTSGCPSNYNTEAFSYEAYELENGAHHAYGTCNPDYV
jgi:hypocretin (orexin) receptor 2